MEKKLYKQDQKNYFAAAAKKTFYFSFDEHFGSRFSFTLWVNSFNFERAYPVFLFAFFEENKLLFQTFDCRKPNAKCGRSLFSQVVESVTKSKQLPFELRVYTVYECWFEMPKNRKKVFHFLLLLGSLSHGLLNEVPEENAERKLDFFVVVPSS